MKRNWSRAVKAAGELLPRLPGQLGEQLRAEALLAEYRERRRRYWQAAEARGLAYRDDAVVERTRRRLADKKVAVRSRRPGEVRTLAFLPDIGWHLQLLPALRRLGPLEHFDYQAAGNDYRALFTYDDDAAAVRRRISEQFEAAARAAVRDGGVDWVFVYGSGIEVLAPSLARVREVTGAPIVGMCFDDKQSWELPRFGEQRAGQIDIAAELDLAWTSARVACEWYLVEGGNPIFLPEGCDPELYRPPADTRSLADVCFVGQAYGYRRGFVERLRSLGLTVSTRGDGWSDGRAGDEEVAALFARSKVILGLGGIGWSADLKNVKGRDFDAPCAGGGVYLASYNPDLARFFDVGREIACFSSADEAVEVARELVVDDARRAEMARRARERCLREHTWDHRFETVLRTLGVL